MSTPPGTGDPVAQAARTLGSFLSRWGRSYLAQLAGGRFRFPTSRPGEGPVHFIVVVANHFEPMSNDWNASEAARAVARWCRRMDDLTVTDSDGHRFKHTYFFPAEQYDPAFLAPLAEHCAGSGGEVEVHLHHGVDKPDTSANLERVLRQFVERLVAHGCLARDRHTGRVGYCFVHGNWALANSAGGRMCGVDNEMEILDRTGCYLDCTLPCAPQDAQVPVINSIYECARPLSERAPHRLGRPLAVGRPVVHGPVLLQGPLLVDWARRRRGLPVPRVENGDLSREAPPTLQRFRLWARANVHVAGRPTWLFVKVHTHGLIERHMETLVGDPMKGFLDDLLAAYGDGRSYRVHFTTAREAANIALAAVDGHAGDPGQHRNYCYLPARSGPLRPLPWGREGVGGRRAG